MGRSRLSPALPGANLQESLPAVIAKLGGASRSRNFLDLTTQRWSPSRGPSRPAGNIPKRALRNAQAQVFKVTVSMTTEPENSGEAEPEDRSLG
jgi:hypothetical protein